MLQKDPNTTAVHEFFGQVSDNYTVMLNSSYLNDTWLSDSFGSLPSDYNVTCLDVGNATHPMANCTLYSYPIDNLSKFFASPLLVVSILVQIVSGIL